MLLPYMDCVPCLRQYIIHTTAQVAQGLNAFVLDTTLSFETRLCISLSVLFLGLLSIKLNDTPTQQPVIVQV